MWPERSASSSRRSGRPSRRNGGDRADLGGRRGALPEPIIQPKGASMGNGTKNGTVDITLSEGDATVS